MPDPQRFTLHPDFTVALEAVVLAGADENPDLDLSHVAAIAAHRTFAERLAMEDLCLANPFTDGYVDDLENVLDAARESGLLTGPGTLSVIDDGEYWRADARIPVPGRTWTHLPVTSTWSAWRDLFEVSADDALSDPPAQTLDYSIRTLVDHANIALDTLDEYVRARTLTPVPTTAGE